MQLLHLEDDGALREILKQVLTAVEPTLTLHHFISSEDALDFIKGTHTPIDLFILDIRVLGEIDGIEVARQIRKEHYTSPIVLTSAFRRPSLENLDELDCLWMPKPWELINAPHVLLPMARDHYNKRTAQT